MKPLFVIFIQLGIGGVERKIVDIVNFLGDVQTHLPIYLLLRRKSKFDVGEKIRNKNVKIIYYPDWYKIKIPFFFPLFVIYQVWKLNPKAILAFLDLPCWAAVWSKIIFFWRKIKVVLSEDHYTSKSIGNYNFSIIRSFLIKIFYPLADVIFTPSKATKKDLINTFKIPPKKIRVISNWTNFTQEQPGKQKKVYDLIYTGRFDKEKNLNFLIRGIIRLKKYKKDIKLCLLGGGKEEKTLMDFVRKNNLEKNVKFLKPSLNVKSYLKKAKIFVLSSETEGLPISALEAMALALPVISSNYTGVDELIKNRKTGLIYNNLDEFVAKAYMFLRNNHLRKKIGFAAQKYVKYYHSSENINIYIDALNL